MGDEGKKNRVKGSNWLGGKHKKQGVSGGAAVRDLSHLWKLFPFSFLSGYGTIACLPVVFQDCLLTHTFVKGPVQMGYENQLHLLDTSVTSLSQAAEGRSSLKTKASRMWHRTEVLCQGMFLSFCRSIYARINRKGCESMSSHKSWSDLTCISLQLYFPSVLGRVLPPAQLSP